LYGNTQHNLPSRFIADIPEEIIDQTNNGKVTKAQDFFSDEQFSQEEFESPDLNEGDLVRHPLFGEGKVVSIDDSEATIQFNRVGQKTLNLQYAPLHKI
jgi:hypothetical protein